MYTLKKKIPKIAKRNLDLQFRVASIEEYDAGEVYRIYGRCHFCDDMIDFDLCNRRCPFYGNGKYTCNLGKWFENVLRREKVCGKGEGFSFTGDETYILANSKTAAIALVRRTRKALKKYIEWV